MKKIIFIMSLLISNLTFAAASNLIGIDGFSSPPTLALIDPGTGVVHDSIEISVSGETINSMNGIAVHPQTGDIYLLGDIDPVRSSSSRSKPYKTSGDYTDAPASGPFRSLIKLDAATAYTGVGVEVGALGDLFAGITFASNGTLYGVTGDGANNSEELYTIDINDGSISFVMALGNGSDGESIAFNPNDNLIYHSSGNGIGSVIFESIDPVAMTVTPIVTVAGYNDEGLALAFNPYTGSFILGGFTEIFDITTAGVATDLSDNAGDIYKGFIYAPFPTAPVATVPTTTFWGLALLVVGMFMMVLFRRKDQV